MKNGIKGTHIATRQPVEVELTPTEMRMCNSTGSSINVDWEKAMELVLKRTGQEIIGQVSIETIVKNGVDRVFH